MEKLIPLCAAISSNVIEPLIVVGVEGPCEENAGFLSPTENSRKLQTSALRRIGRTGKCHAQMYARNLPKLFRPSFTTDIMLFV